MNPSSARLPLVLLTAATLSGAALAQLPRVALVVASSGCGATNPQTVLQASGQFAVVDWINTVAPPTGVGTPSLATLLQYDAVMVWTNLTPQNNNALGDVLADYVDAGGGVVVTVFANSTTTAGRNIGGRWQTGYEVILDQSGNATGSGHTLGTVHVPSHPVMAGVTSFVGGTTGSRPNGTALEVGSYLVAEWSNGKVLVAQGGNPRRIDLGFYPVQASCSQSGYASGGDLMMINALKAVADGGTFAPYGAGCAGSLGVPTWLAIGGSRPALGTTLDTQIDGVVSGLGLIGVGLTKDTWGPFPLPLDLSFLGMGPGCNLLADPVVTQVAVGAPPTAQWSFAVPLNPAIIGLIFYGQGFPYDPAANSFGFTVTNAARIKFGL